MRQTIIKDGLAQRLQDILGSDKAVSSSFSIQSSMLENMNRICKAMVGNNINGRVMSGMQIDPANGYVDIGYGVTYNGNIVKLGAKRQGDNWPGTGASYIHVYAVYNVAERSGVNYSTLPNTLYPENGGYTSDAIRSKPVNIIKDQIGASIYGDETGAGSSIRYDISSNVSTAPNEIYIGTIYPSSNRVSYPDYNKGTVDYTYVLNQASTPVWTATNAIANNTSMSMLADSRTGKNFLKTVSLVLKQPTTTFAPRIQFTDTTNPPSNYMIRMLIKQYKANTSSPITSSQEFTITDSVDAYNYMTFDVNQTLEQDTKYIGLYFTATSFGTDSTHQNFSTTSGYADVNFVIEKLT